MKIQVNSITMIYLVLCYPTKSNKIGFFSLRFMILLFLMSHIFLQIFFVFFFQQEKGNKPKDEKKS